jgi:hypothetical protein
VKNRFLKAFCLSFAVSGFITALALGAFAIGGQVYMATHNAEEHDWQCFTDMECELEDRARHD